LSVSVTRSARGESGDDEMTGDVCEHGSLRRKCEICERDIEIRELQDSLWAQHASSSNIREAEKKILIAEIEKNNKLRAELVAIASAMHAYPDSDLVSLAETLYASDQACAASQSGMHCRDNLIAQLRADLAASQAERARLRNALLDIRDGGQMRTGYTYAALARAALAV
jgi:hypothetical protein